MLSRQGCLNKPHRQGFKKSRKNAELLEGQAWVTCCEEYPPSRYWGGRRAPGTWEMHLEPFWKMGKADDRCQVFHDGLLSLTILPGAGLEKMLCCIRILFAINQ